MRTHFHFVTPLTLRLSAFVLATTVVVAAFLPLLSIGAGIVS